MGRAAGVNASEGRLSSSRASPRFSLSRGWPMMAREEIGGHPEPFFLRVGGVRDFNRGHPPRESAAHAPLDERSQPAALLDPLKIDDRNGLQNDNLIGERQRISRIHTLWATTAWQPPASARMAGV